MDKIEHYKNILNFFLDKPIALSVLSWLIIRRFNNIVITCEFIRVCRNTAIAFTKTKNFRATNNYSFGLKIIEKQHKKKK